MATRAEIEIRERAERALRAGRAHEALDLYGKQLAAVKTVGGQYDAWLAGAASAYDALGRGREAGYTLLGLGRFAEAQRRFPAAERPLEWALCAARLGHPGEAARVLSEAGHPALAAIELGAAGAPAAARVEWQRVLADRRLRGRPYETALAQFNLGETLLALGDRAGAGRELATAARLLEAVADELETRGERERAFDCYSVLLRLGKDAESFEDVAEGYLNGIRILAADDQQFYAVQYYDDFIAHAIARGEHYAAATVARDAAAYSLKVGLPYDRHFHQRAAELWAATARHNQEVDGPVDLSANALAAAIDAAATLGDVAAVARLYAALAELPLPETRRARYRVLARRYETEIASPPPPAPAFPAYLRRTDTYQDVWRQDMIEWDLDGDPTSVLARLVVERPETTYARLALRALLLCNDPGFSPAAPARAAELAVALGRVRLYEVLRPLERLYEHPAVEVRAAVMRGVAQVYCTRSFALVRKGLVDAAAGVADEALRALRKLRFRDGLEPLSRIFRESTDPRVRSAALDSIAGVGSPDGAIVLLDAVRQEVGAIRDAAVAGLAALAAREEIAALVRHAREIETGERRELLELILRQAGQGASLDGGARGKPAPG